MRQPHQVAAPVVLAAHHLALGRAHQRGLVPGVVAVPRLAAQGVHLEVHQPVVVEVVPLGGARTGVVHLVVAVLVFYAPLLHTPVARGAHHAPPPVVIPSVGHAVAVAAAHYPVVVVVGELDGLAEPVARAGEVAPLVVLVFSQRLKPALAQQVGREDEPAFIVETEHHGAPVVILQLRQQPAAPVVGEVQETAAGIVHAHGAVYRTALPVGEGTVGRCGIGLPHRPRTGLRPALPQFHPTVVFLGSTHLHSGKRQ